MMYPYAHPDHGPEWYAPDCELAPSGRSWDEVEIALHRYLDDGLTPDEVVDLGLLSAVDVEDVTGWPVEVMS